MLFIAIAFLLGKGLTLILPYGLRLATGTPGMPLDTIRYELIGFGIVGIASLLVSLAEHHPFKRYALRRAACPARSADRCPGVDGAALRGIAVLAYGAAWLACSRNISRAASCNTRSRGVAGIVRAVAPDNARARTIGFWAAASVFSVGQFAAGHLANKGETVMGLVSVALAGLAFVYVLYRTGSLWWAIGFHATWDWAQSFVDGVRDSGLVVEGRLLMSRPAGRPLLSGGDTGPGGQRAGRADAAADHVHHPQDAAQARHAFDA